MKKILILAMAGLLVFGMAACGSSDSNDKTPVDTTVNQSDADTEDVAVSSDVSVEEQVIYDENDVKVTVTGMSDSMWGPELTVLIENNGSTNVTVQTRNESVNGVMMPPMFSCDVAAGKKANSTITFMESDLDTAGIDVIKEIELKVHLFDTDSWEDIHTSEYITITTDADPSYEQKYDDSGFVAVDKDGVKIVLKKLDSDDSFWGADVYAYIENNTDQDITVQARDVSINGFMIDPMFSCDVVAGKKANTTITFFEEDLELNGISDITEMELSFVVFDMESWEDIFETDAMTVTFE